MTRVFSRCGPAANANGEGIPERVRQIIEEVAEEHGLTLQILIGPARQRIPSRARFAAFARIRERVVINGSPASYPLIGKWFGNRDHTSILHGVQVAARGDCEPVDWSKVSNRQKLRLGLVNTEEPVQNQARNRSVRRAPATLSHTT